MLNPSSSQCLVESFTYCHSDQAEKLTQLPTLKNSAEEQQNGTEEGMTSPSLTTHRHAAIHPGGGRITGCSAVKVTPLRSGGERSRSPRSGNDRVLNVSSTLSSRAITTCALKPPPSYGGRAKEKKINPRDLFTFSYRFNTDIPMGETPGASIDEYLMNRPRIVGAVFPDKRKRTKLNDEVWSVRLIPIQFLFLSACPVIAIRFVSRSGGEGYPPHVPVRATSLLLMEVTDYKLEGLQSDAIPSHLAVAVRGTLYPQPDGRRSLKGHVEMSVGFNLPPVLALVPQPIIRGVADTVLRQLAQQMKHDFDTGLAADFKKYRREKLTEKRSKH